MNQSLYSKYLLEREAFNIVEDDKGFATYKIFGEECYIRDVYVLPEFRQTKVASSYSDKITQIAKEQGCKYLTGTVYPKALGSTESLTAILKYGFKLQSSNDEKIVLVKEIL